MGNSDNTKLPSGDYADPAYGNTRDVESSDKSAFGYDVTAYHVVELYNDNLTVNLELPPKINAEGMPCSSEVVCKHDACHYYASIDEAHGDSVSDDFYKPIEEMFHYFLSLHLLIKVSLDPSACVRCCIPGACTITLNRLNNHGLH